MLLIIIVVAVACLVFGATTGPLWLLWVALGGALLGLVVLAANVQLRRKAAIESPKAARAEASTIEEGGPRGEPVMAAAVPGETSSSAADRSGSVSTAGSVESFLTPQDSQDDEPSMSSRPEPVGVPDPAEHALAERTEPEWPAGAVEVSEESAQSLVLVIAGRHRFHAPGCRLVEGRTSQKVSLEEALEEGFSPCTTCAPTGRPA